MTFYYYYYYYYYYFELPSHIGASLIMFIYLLYLFFPQSWPD